MTPCCAPLKTENGAWCVGALKVFSPFPILVRKSFVTYVLIKVLPGLVYV